MRAIRFARNMQDRDLEKIGDAGVDIERCSSTSEANVNAALVVWVPQPPSAGASATDTVYASRQQLHLAQASSAPSAPQVVAGALWAPARKSRRSRCGCIETPGAPPSPPSGSLSKLEPSFPPVPLEAIAQAFNDSRLAFEILNPTSIFRLDDSQRQRHRRAFEFACLTPVTGHTPDLGFGPDPPSVVPYIGISRLPAKLGRVIEALTPDRLNHLIGLVNTATKLITTICEGKPERQSSRLLLAQPLEPPEVPARPSLLPALKSLKEDTPYTQQAPILSSASNPNVPSPSSSSPNPSDAVPASNSEPEISTTVKQPTSQVSVPKSSPTQKPTRHPSLLKSVLNSPAMSLL